MASTMCRSPGSNPPKDVGNEGDRCRQQQDDSEKIRKLLEEAPPDGAALPFLEPVRTVLLPAFGHLCRRQPLLRCAEGLVNIQRGEAGNFFQLIIGRRCCFQLLNPPRNWAPQINSTKANDWMTCVISRTSLGSFSMYSGFKSLTSMVYAFPLRRKYFCSPKSRAPLSVVCNN